MEEPSEKEAEERGREMVSKLMEGKLTLLRCVEQLGGELTSDSTLERTKGMLVLVRVLESVRTVLTKHEVGHILSFLCDRLKDWHTLRPTLTSLKVLLGGRLQRKRRADESEEEEEEEEEYRERQLKQEGEKTTSATTSGKRNRAAALLTPENVKLLATSFFSHVDGM